MVEPNKESKTKKFDPNKEQLQAITSKKKKIIVNSSAGTGKTTVLTRRIIHFVKTEKYNVTDFLALTFTKSAAEEMKSRVEKLIQEEIELSKCKELSEHLENQLELLPSSYISTFHSFCTRIIEENYTLVNLRPKVSVASPFSIKNIIRKELEKLFYEKMKDESNYFYLQSFYKKGLDDTFTEAMMNFLRAISFKESEVDLKEYLDNNLSLYNWEENKIPRKFIQEFGESEILRTINKDIWNTDISEDVFLNYVEQAKVNGEKGDWLKSASKDNRKIILKILDVNKAKEYSKPLKQKIKWLQDFALELKERVDERKSVLGVLSYDDLILKFLELINNKDFFNTQIDSYFKEVMIDEFQDTSYNQFKFAKLLTKPRLFIVGDKKQSIYRFNGARPELFENLVMEASSKKNEEVINLVQNYRSHSEILHFVNLVFKNIYRNNHSTKFQYNAGDSFEISNPKDIKGEKKIIENVTLGEKTSMDSWLKECFMRINELVSSGKNKYSDFLILTKNNIDFFLLKNMSREYDIPINTSFKAKAAASPLISITYNFLKLIENELDDDALIATLLYVFKFDEEEIIKIKILENQTSKDSQTLKKGFLYLIMDYVRRGSDENIIKKANEFLKSLNTLSNAFNTMDLKSFFKYLFLDFNLLEKCSIKGEEEEALVWYQYLLNKVNEMNENSEKSLFSLLDTISEGKEDLSSPIEGHLVGERNSVSVMTIHKAKGLESKVVFLIASSKKSRNKGMTDQDEGVHFNHEDLELNIKETLPQKELLKYKEKTLEFYDSINLLYVALTRAKDRIIIINTPEKKPAFLENKPNLSGILNFLKRQDFWERWVLESSNSSFALAKSIKEASNKTILNKNLIGKKTSKHFLEEKIKFETLWEDEEIKGLEYGTRIHKAFEDYFLNPNKLETNQEKKIVNRFITNDSVSNILKEAISLKPEVPLLYELKDQIKRGRIDLLIETKSHSIIIDYKTDNVTNTEKLISTYKDQLLGYKKEIDKNQKNTRTFIYSTHLDKLIEI